jgi:REP element-mobilizing transposase RayT
MTYARKSLVSLQDTPYYHVIARCVRRAWLWGFDEYAGKDYSHRKAWVLERIRYLTEIFAMDVCAYAVMSNHYHLVVHVDASRATAWTEGEVIQRWSCLFRLPALVQAYRDAKLDTEVERSAARLIIERWRSRLYDVSWLMRALNESLARRANLEDGCKGRFWEGRFRSQALLDEAGLLTAMVYVDLNPIRAGIAKSPEECEFTSIYERIRLLRASTRVRGAKERRAEVPLMPLGDSQIKGRPVVPFTVNAYLQLADWTGRAVRRDKRGHIDASLPPILLRLNIDAIAWHQAMRTDGNKLFGRALGRLGHLKVHAERLKQKTIRGRRRCEQLYN